jgi:hypothetical protein
LIAGNLPTTSTSPSLHYCSTFSIPKKKKFYPLSILYQHCQQCLSILKQPTYFPHKLKIIPNCTIYTQTLSSSHQILSFPFVPIGARVPHSPIRGSALK